MTSKPDYNLPVNETEWDRLDEQSNGMDNLLDNKLCPEDIGQPRKILDIGAGSGAWAIKVAKRYPDADVVAADMNPLPARPLPSNLRYEKVNALEPFPFPAGTFDVVHIRLTLTHLKEGASALSRIVDLVAPGGWLLVDEINWSDKFEGLGNAPGIKSALTHIIGSTKAVNGDPHFGTKLKAYLEASDKLSESHVREVDVPLNSAHEDPLVAAFGRTFKDTLTRAVAGAPLKTPTEGEMQKSFLDNMADEGLDWQYSLQFYFSWSKKRA
ncbi:S-adenosyl-L-methionine-dependent methyltransferase [Mycena vitilis]|nr:S-adenosyl-L-methionine-dependent methyltransferase [Mycena vitilis]